MTPGQMSLIIDASAGGVIVVYEPSLDYSDARNSFYRAMGL